MLAGLGDEFDAIAKLLRRNRDRPSASLSSSLLPDLTEETYRHGMSALSDALELLEFADGRQRRRLEGELAEIEDRLGRDTHADERAKARDEQRRASHRRLLARHDEARQRARDLMFEAERCTAALAEARIELASVRAGDRQVDVEAVVETLRDLDPAGARRPGRAAPARVLAACHAGGPMMPNEHEPEHRDPSHTVISVTPDRSAIAPLTMSADEIELAAQPGGDAGPRRPRVDRIAQLAVLDEVTSVGVESQRNAGRQLELVKTRLATFLDAGGASKDIALELVDLRGRARPHQPRAAATQPLGPNRRDAPLHA